MSEKATQFRVTAALIVLFFLGIFNLAYANYHISGETIVIEVTPTMKWIFVNLVFIACTLGFISFVVYCAIGPRWKWYFLKWTGFFLFLLLGVAGALGPLTEWLWCMIAFTPFLIGMVWMIWTRGKELDKTLQEEAYKIEKKKCSIQT